MREGLFCTQASNQQNKTKITWNILGALDFDEYYSQNTSKLPGGKGIQCLLCSKVTIHAGNMKQHFEVHHYQRTYRCEVCQKFFKTKNSLDCHKKGQGHYVMY